MNKLGSAIKLMFRLPPVWGAALALAAAAAFANWEPFVDIAAYAARRLFAG
jgi:hypothetical protein